MKKPHQTTILAKKTEPVADVLRCSKHKALALAAAAMVVQGRAAVTLGEDLITVPAVSFRYSEYHDFQNNHERRMKVQSPQIAYEAPLSDKSDLQFSALFDAMSGASATYLSTLSGASGLGIKDNRTGLTARYRNFGERTMSGLSFGFSDEDDYKSYGLGYFGRTYFDDKQTAVTYSASGALDQIGSSNNPELSEHSHTVSASVGIQRLLTRQTSLGFDLQGWSRDGYLTDPYKFFDNRPRSRDGVALAARLTSYEEDLSTAFHLSTVVAHDSWGMSSLTLEGAAVSRISEGLYLTPTLRYRSQTAASFFNTVPDDFVIPPGFFSADQRLGRFGEFSIGLDLTKELGDSWTVDVAGEFLMQRTSWALGHAGTSHIEPFYAQLVSFGVTKKFR